MDLANTAPAPLEAWLPEQHTRRKLLLRECCSEPEVSHSSQRRTDAMAEGTWWVMLASGG
jgi:hypothetical protein